MQYSNGPNGSCLFAKGTLQIDLLTEAAPVNLVGLASSSGRLSTAPSHAFARAIVWALAACEIPCVMACKENTRIDWI